jgi:hypothetical protein
MPGIVTMNPKKGEKGRRAWLYTALQRAAYGGGEPATAAGAHG